MNKTPPARPNFGFTICHLSLFPWVFASPRVAWRNAHRNTLENPRSNKNTEYKFKVHTSFFSNSKTHFLATARRLARVFRRCPSTPKFLHFPGSRVSSKQPSFRACSAFVPLSTAYAAESGPLTQTKPLDGVCCRIWSTYSNQTSRRHMLHNLVRLLKPSHGAFSLLFVGLPTLICFF